MVEDINQDGNHVQHHVEILRHKWIHNPNVKIGAIFQLLWIIVILGLVYLNKLHVHPIMHRQPP